MLLNHSYAIHIAYQLYPSSSARNSQSIATASR